MAGHGEKRILIGLSLSKQAGRAGELVLTSKTGVQNEG